MVKVRGRNSNGKAVKQTAENWHVRGFVTSWCHTGATSQSWQGHATKSRYSWSAGISPRQVMTWCWHEDDCDRHLAHHRDAVQSRCFEPWPDVTHTHTEEIFVTFWYLWASCRQVSIVDCSNGVFSSINRLRWTQWRSCTCCPSCQIFGAVRFEPKRSFLDSPRERRCSCAVDFWHIVVKPRRRKTTRTYYMYRFWKSRWNKESVCNASGLCGFVRRYLSTGSLRITSNFFRCTMYLASHSVLCHCLVKQHSRNDKKKKKKKKKKKIVRCQCTTKLTQVSSFSESHPSHGRARHQIRDWSESGHSRELLTPGTMTHAGRVASSPEIFGHFWPSVWPSSRSNFDLGPSPLDSTEKNLSYQSLWFWSAVFL